jgi:pyruvate,water dikinase
MQQLTLTQVWGCFLIFTLCPLLGGLPLIDWITFGLTGKKITKLGTGNISVSAAFYHGGKWIGICAVLAEAFKGIGAVFLARYFFPLDPVWELISLIALVMGRYWIGKGAGTTNVVWGIIAHDYLTAILIFIVGGISFTFVREKKAGKWLVLILLPIAIALRYINDPARIIAAMSLSALLAGIYQKIPDDLNLPVSEVQSESQQMFYFFRGDQAILTLNKQLDPQKVGQKAATLARLKQLGYPIPEGWIFQPGDDLEVIVSFLNPSVNYPLVVRSSAIGEDTDLTSAAGQYNTFLNITTPEQLETAIINCLESYHNFNAIQYRQDHHQQDQGMNVLIQKQINGVFSGVAFSRDPVNQLDEAIAIEALPGATIQVVSGKVTPRQYRVYDQSDQMRIETPENQPQDLPEKLIIEVALLTQKITQLYQNIPQDIEWTYDGEKLWILQVRPITNLQPIWTRKIAAEVIPGLIHPLTWSINQPLTCGVWGEIFSIVLGKNSQDLDFTQTATLHYHQAYFNASLLGKIFLRMGLPPESLEFLTRGAKFSKPPLISTIQNIPGLMRLLQREWNLERDFKRDYKDYFIPNLTKSQAKLKQKISEPELLENIEIILATLKKATYYSILAPLSFAIRQAIFKVSLEKLDQSKTPEVKSITTLANLANAIRKLIPLDQIKDNNCAELFSYFAEIPEGQSIRDQIDQWLDQFGYLSDVATDISVPRWQENRHPVRELLTEFILDQERCQQVLVKKTITWKSWQNNLVQKRLNLKGKVSEIYSQLLAQLRWSFIALEKLWLASNLLDQEGDIFFLKLSEIQEFINQENPKQAPDFKNLIQQRRWQLEEDRQIKNLPYLIYGNTLDRSFIPGIVKVYTANILQGIGASIGQIEGKIKIITSLQIRANIDAQTIIVVPYTDSGWSPLISRAGGIISEVGGKLSHGAIIAREYGIPAVMDVQNATQIFRDGQRVRLDGQKGIIEVLS